MKQIVASLKFAGVKLKTHMINKKILHRYGSSMSKQHAALPNHHKV